MCLYPRLIENGKYKSNKKNGGIPPPLKDHRTYYVPIGCNTCIECRKQKARDWQTRLQEDIKEHTNGKFVTLTFNTESLCKLMEEKKCVGLKGYDLDNAIATLAMRRFNERWRKKYKKALRHWVVTELGHGNTEHIHLHGIVYTDQISQIEQLWGYGWVWKGNVKNGKIENYVNSRTVNYITKYITKIDKEHLNYKALVLTSPGIGHNYKGAGNKYNGDKTNECYRTNTGHKIAMPIYWRNKIYNDEEREKLWLQKLDKNERWVCGEKVRIRNKEEEENYYQLVEYHRNRTVGLGYPTPEYIWSKKAYEEQRRRMLQEKRISNSPEADGGTISRAKMA